MAKFLTLWEHDMSRIPDDPKEQLRVNTMLVNMVKEDMKRGVTLDWGMFAGGGLGGYAICEGTELEITMENLKYSPYITCTTYPILSVNQVEELIAKLQG